MAFDYKKEYKEFYMPNDTPSIVTVPKMNYIAVRGVGDPNEEGGEYKQAIGLLYAIAFTIKMSKKGSHQIEGYFDYVVPPLEDFSKVEFFSYDEGLCVKCMHVGAYDDEPATVELMHKFAEEQGYVLDITEKRLHHEIYLSDARKVVPEKLKTVIRHPIRKES
jgi:hypothetical protein